MEVQLDLTFVCQLVDFELILRVSQTAGSLWDSIGESGLHTFTVNCETFAVLLCLNTGNNRANA